MAGALQCEALRDAVEHELNGQRAASSTPTMRERTFAPVSPKDVYNSRSEEQRDMYGQQHGKSTSMTAATSVRSLLSV
jgi:hypothetical protein